VSENKGLRKVGAGRDSKHNEKLHDLYFSQNIRVAISRWLIWMEHVVRMRKRKSAYRALVSKSEGKTALGRTRRRWEDNVKVDLK